MMRVLALGYISNVLSETDHSTNAGVFGRRWHLMVLKFETFREFRLVYKLFECRVL